MYWVFVSLSRIRWSSTTPLWLNGALDTTTLHVSGYGHSKTLHCTGKLQQVHPSGTSLQCSFEVEGPYHITLQFAKASHLPVQPLKVWWPQGKATWDLPVHRLLEEGAVILPLGTCNSSYSPSTMQVMGAAQCLSHLCARVPHPPPWMASLSLIPCGVTIPEDVHVEVMAEQKHTTDKSGWVAAINQGRQDEAVAIIAHKDPGRDPMIIPLPKHVWQHTGPTPCSIPLHHSSGDHVDLELMREFDLHVGHKGQPLPPTPCMTRSGLWMMVVPPSQQPLQPLLRTVYNVSQSTHIVAEGMHITHVDGVPTRSSSPVAGTLYEGVFAHGRGHNTPPTKKWMTP